MAEREAFELEAYCRRERSRSLRPKSRPAATGGESGIRTHVRVSPKHAFQACAFNHSAISPALKEKTLAAASVHDQHSTYNKAVSLTRRAVLLSATAVACGRRKAQPFQGYCFVANQQSRTLAAVDLSRFRVRKNIALDAAPAAVVQHPSRAVVFVLAPETGSVFQVDAATLAITNRAQ